MQLLAAPLAPLLLALVVLTGIAHTDSFLLLSMSRSEITMERMIGVRTLAQGEKGADHARFILTHTSLPCEGREYKTGGGCTAAA